MVYILRFDESFQVVFEDFSEVVLQFRSPKVFQDLLPIWRHLDTDTHRKVREMLCVKLLKFTHIKSTQIWFEFSGEDLQGGTLANTVGAYETQDLTWTWNWQTMQLEGIG